MHCHRNPKNACILVTARYISLVADPDVDRDARVFGTYRRMDPPALALVAKWEIHFDPMKLPDSQDLPLVTALKDRYIRVCRKPDWPIDNGNPKSPLTNVWELR